MLIKTAILEEKQIKILNRKKQKQKIMLFLDLLTPPYTFSSSLVPNNSM